MVAAAVVGGAVIGGVATAYSGNKAADATKEGAERSAAVEQYMYDTTRKDYEPYRETGVQALDQLSGLYGIQREDGTTGPADYSAFYESPDYQFSFDQGMRAVNQSLAKRGVAPETGAGLKSLTRFGQGLASQQLGNYKNSLASLAGIGQTSTAQLAGIGQGAATNIGNSYQNAADARASSYLNTGSAVAGTANRVGDYYMLKDAGYL